MTVPPSFLDTWQCEKIGSGHKDSLEKLQAFQLAQLKKTISHAKKNSGFYKRHFKDVRVEAITGLDEFAAIPFTFPLQLQENGYSFLCVSQDEIKRIVTLETTGTTAAPKRIFFTASDLEKTIDFFCLVLSQLIRLSETALILLPGNTPASAGNLLKTAMDRIKGKGIVHGLITDFNKTMDILHTHAPSVIIGMPVQVLALCDLLKQKNNIPKFVRHVILTSDYVSPVVKHRIGQIINCRVFDHYGMTETGFGGGIDCFAHSGYHLRETDLYFEIIDPDTGKTVPKGEWGEITVTTLSRKGMPLIRYRTGDISRFCCDPCACGSLFRRMDYIRYRYSHTILLPNGLRFGMPDLDDLFFKIPQVIDFDACLISRQGRHYLDIILKTFDNSMIQNIDIKKKLPYSPVLENAFKTGAIHLGSIQTETFKFKDTYTGKRRIDHITE